jgi:hypothetical protein
VISCHSAVGCQPNGLSAERGVDVNVITSGRTDLGEYFRLSGIREYQKLTHTPFLVFLISGDTAEVGIVDNAKKLLITLMKHK